VPDEAPSIDPIWDDVAFVIRTGDNVYKKRIPSQLVTWVHNLPRKNVVYVSDADALDEEFIEYEGYSVKLPKIYDGVTPYAVPEDKHSLPTA